MKTKTWFVRSALLLAACLISSAAFCQLKSQLVVSGLTRPVAIHPDPTDPSVLFVIEQRSGTVGSIRVIQNGSLLATPFLSISPVSTGSEQGLLGMAFAPDYPTSRDFYVNYTDSAGATNIVRYRRNALNPLQADPGSAQLILKLAQPFSNHNAGSMIFGPDGMLYIALGDGGSGNDPGNRAQSSNTLLGKMLRIDPSSDGFPADPDKNYAVPSTNPFVGVTGVLGEIWAFGLRNPWKFTDDPASMLGHDSWLIADVGQNAIEEIDYEFPNQGGRNYGWRVWEGTSNTGLGGLSTVQPTVTFPIYEYNHSLGQSITGGYVYRGVMLGPEFFGRYFYADFITSRIWSIALDVNPGAQTVVASGNAEHTAALGASNNISTFGRGLDGELYFAKYNGQIHRILPLNRVWMIDLDPYNSMMLSGSLRHLVAQDGHGVPVTPLNTASRTGTLNFQGGVQVAFETDQMTTSVLNATIRLSTNQGVGGTARLLLRNWTTGQFVEVGSGGFASGGTTVTINNITAAPYRRADGRIEAIIRGDVSVSGFASRTVVTFDQVRLTSN